MKKYITPTAKAVILFEESDIMLQTGSAYADEEQGSNKRDNSTTFRSIWDN